MIPNGFHGYTVHFGTQVLATALALIYALVAGAVTFTIVDRLVGLRVSEEEELRGLDMSEHGTPAYPEFLEVASDRRAPLHILSGVRVSQVMNEIPAAAPGDTLESAQEIMFSREVFALPVLSEDGELCGILSMSDIMKIERSERASVRVAAVYSREVQYAFPDQTMHEVVERMREHHLANFPVVSRRDEKQLLGMVTKSDIMMAYRQMAIEYV